MRKLYILWFLMFMNLAFAGNAIAQNATARLLPDFTDLAEKQAKVVVNISTTQIIRQQRDSLPLFPFNDDEMPEFFRRFLPHGLPDAAKESERRSLGSGFILSEDGYLLTNAHVVAGADEVTVRLSDKREFSAQVVGADKRTDVALLKIEAKGLPFARLGESEKLRVGEWVVAIGSPFGLESTVTAGIVSAKGRALPQENYVPFIQTDVAVNPGNSGGPLFNLAGEVVGINSQIYSRNGGYMGLSFAIPIDVAMDVQRQLRATGRVSRGLLGVAIQDVSKELAESFGLEKPVGALVSLVEKGGAADKAGVEAGDVILRFNGKAVEHASELPRQVAATRPGANVTLQIWRKGKLHDLSVTVGEARDDSAPLAQGSKAPESSHTSKLGLILRALSPEQRHKLGIRESGLLVDDASGNAIRAGLRPGDILLVLIVKGASYPLALPAQLEQRLAQIPKGTNFTFLIRRGENQTFVTLKKD
ncbi:MAG: DegQ family serine endoprotease [Zoogloeaceae bacterium]|jgi:serine protease Do|nr:DegQ family serine endoprotease [Zoogloeaceae bacterium]